MCPELACRLLDLLDKIIVLIMREDHPQIKAHPLLIAQRLIRFRTY